MAGSLRGRRGAGRAGADRVEMIAREFQVRSVQSHAEMLAISRHFGQLLKRRVLARCEGRPGPNRVTGAYQQDLFYDALQSAQLAQLVVGSYSPYARRLEFGFVGVDSLGRHYNQPPFPHFGPAADETMPEYYAAVERLADFDTQIGGL